MDEQRQGDQLEHAHILEDPPEAMDDMEVGESGSEISMLMARRDDDDDDEN